MTDFNRGLVSVYPVTFDSDVEDIVWESSGEKFQDINVEVSWDYLTAGITDIFEAIQSSRVRYLTLELRKDSFESCGSFGIIGDFETAIVRHHSVRKLRGDEWDRGTDLCGERYLRTLVVEGTPFNKRTYTDEERALVFQIIMEPRDLELWKECEASSNYLRCFYLALMELKYGHYTEAITWRYGDVFSEIDFEYWSERIEARRKDLEEA